MKEYERNNLLSNGNLGDEKYSVSFVSDYLAQGGDGHSRAGRVCPVVFEVDGTPELILC